jgi:predicted AAA+ superfamily ATPase
VSTQHPALRTQLGGLFENALLIQLVGDQTYFGEISGWKRDSEGSEVDFVWRQGPIAIPLECKATQKISMKHWSGLKAFLDATNQKIGFLITAAPFKIVKSKDRILVNLPLYLANRSNIMKCIEKFVA